MTDSTNAPDAAKRDTSKRDTVKARREIAEIRIKMKMAGEAIKAATEERKTLRARQVALMAEANKEAKKPGGKGPGKANSAPAADTSDIGD